MHKTIPLAFDSGSMQKTAPKTANIREMGPF